MLIEEVKRPRYWHCLIGPVPDDAIPSCGDGPPRMVARQSVLDITGHDPCCSSGWIEQDAYDRIQRACYPISVSRNDKPKVVNQELIDKPKVVNQALIDKIIKTAQDSDLGLGEPTGKLDIRQYSEASPTALALLLTTAFDDKYDLVSVFAAAFKVMAENED